MTIYNGDCLEVLRRLPDSSVDSVVTDPPYGLSKEPNAAEVLTKWIAGEPYDHGHGGFMGKAWDSFVPHPDVWKEVYRVLKPGGYALVFSGTRTQDLMTIALRLAGFEVRDVIEWLYFSGFPKSMDVSKALDKQAGAVREKVRHKARPETSGTMSGSSDTRPWIEESRKKGYHEVDAKIPVTELAKQWDGWGTALKPAHEPIIIVRKPLAGTVAENVEKYGTGAINIDGCRIGRIEGDRTEYGVTGNQNAMTGANGIYGSYPPVAYAPDEAGRFPANVVTTDADAFYSPYFNVTPKDVCKKSSKKDRNADWTGVPLTIEPKFTQTMGDGIGAREHNPSQKSGYNSNNHPTVKPTDLMGWLVRLVTPPGGVVLDPFSGSGSTLVAAKREGFEFIGIEREPEYVEIIAARTHEVPEPKTA